MLSRLVDMSEGKYLVYSENALVALGEHTSVIRIPELVLMEEGPEKEQLLKMLERNIHLLPLMDRDEGDEEIWKYLSNMVPQRVVALDFGVLKNIMDGLGQSIPDEKIDKMLDSGKELGESVMDFLLGTSELREELAGLNLDKLEDDVQNWLETADQGNIEAFQEAVDAQDQAKMLELMGIDVTNLDDFVQIYSLYPSEIESISNKFQQQEGETKEQMALRIDQYLKDTGLDNVIHFIYSDGEELATIFLSPNTNEKANSLLEQTGTKIDNVDDLARLSDDGERIKDEFKTASVELRKANPKITQEELWQSLLKLDLWKD